jgi:hypothetical protein
MTSGAITAYLEQLEHELRLNRAPRRRLLAEAADHLRSCAEDMVAEGVTADEAERVAVERFGAAAFVARRFAHAAASTSARIALVWVAATFLGYAAAAIVFMFAAPRWLLDFPQGAPSMFALQVAFVALVLSALRTLSSRKAPAIDEARLHLVANGALVSAFAVAAAAGAELLLALTRPAAAPWGEATTLIVIYSVAASAAVVAALVAVATAARASAVDALPRQRRGVVSPAAASLVDDVAAAAPPLTALAGFAVAHPARTCALVAGCAFAGVTAVALPGTDFTHDGSVAIGAATTGLVEAAAVAAAYLTLGRALGLRPARR